MIEDFDGPDPTPSRRGHAVVVSVLLVVGVLAGYAAVSSPELRGPFATPRPSAVIAPVPQFTPAPAQRIEIDIPSIPPRTISCVEGPSLLTTVVLVGGEPVSVTKVTSSFNGTAQCTIQWDHALRPIPYYDIGR